ncbi:MAG: tetratricopeptide repeat protein [Candidatus Thiodiazotropha sp. (ex Semelilucina semeliformis)]|nr:tetratricopeptide repeat protein [Candidatus Thiodiazotropha sp. (ex Semelilucina semeliformis)]
MTNPAYIFEGTVDNFDHLVLENSKRGLVLVDFWAPWVGPSLKQREILIELAESYQGRFLLVSVNTDDQKPLAERFGVRSLPSFKLFRHGELVAEYHGVQPEADYPRIVESYVEKPLDETSRQAIATWQAGDPNAALQLLAEAAVSEPTQLAYPALMTKILMRQERFPEAHTLLSALPLEAQDSVEIRNLLAHLDFIVTAKAVGERELLQQQLDSTPEDPELQYALAALSLMSDDIQTALDLLLKLARSQPGYRNGIARKGMQAVLDQLDAQDEQVAHYRRELYRLNY